MAPAAVSPTEALALVRQGGDAYMAKADSRLARGMSALAFSIVGLLAGLALPVAPPDDVAGWGWAAASLVLVSHLLVAVWVLFAWPKRAWGTLLTVSLLCLGGLSLLQALSGPDAPFRALVFIELMVIAAVHTPWRTALAVAVVTLGAGGGLVAQGAGLEQAATAATYALSWSLLSAFVVCWTAAVRVGRARLEEATAEADRVARVDPLSGLGNRRAFDETIRREMARARRNGHPLSLLVADMNDFKRINDDFGHASGDRSLRDVAEVLRTALRTADLCFRWGGDEFAILLPETAVAEADMVGHRLQDAVHVICRDPEGVRLSITVGAAELREGMCADDLLDAADIALLASKARPRPRGVRSAA